MRGCVYGEQGSGRAGALAKPNNAETKKKREPSSHLHLRTLAAERRDTHSHTHTRTHAPRQSLHHRQAALPPPARRRRGSGDDLLAILLPVSTRVADLALRHHLPHRQPGQAVAVEPGPVRDDGQGGGGDAGTVDLEGEREG